MNFSQQVRDTICESIGGAEFTAQDVARHLELVTDREKQPLYAVLREFRKRGEIKTVRKGVYIHALKRDLRPAGVQRRMWSILRSRRTVSVEDMVALAGASEGYAKEFLQLLGRQRIVRRIDDPQRQKPSKWQMIADPVKMPRNGDKADRLRRIRAAKRKASFAIDRAADALASLRTALGEIPEGDDE